MTYKTFNELLEVSSSTPIKVFEYTNITRSRLFVNKFDLLPDIYFAKQGKILIKKNGIVIYENNLLNNKLAKFSQFPIRSLISFIDRDETLVIEIYNFESDYELTDIEIGISLELDFEDLPVSSVLIPFSIGELSQITLKQNLFPITEYTHVNNEKYFKEFNAVGYKNLLFTVLAKTAFSPTVISEIHNEPPIDFIEKLKNGYWGNNSPLTKSGEITDLGGIINYDYAVNTDRLTTGLPTGYGFYDEDDNIFDPAGTNGVYDSDIVIFDTDNLNSQNKTYSFILSSSSAFKINVAFMFPASIAHSYSRNFNRTSRFNGRYFLGTTTQNEIFRFSFKGKRVFTSNTLQLIVEGSNQLDFVDYSILYERENYDDSELEIDFQTRFRYLRFRKIITYNLIIQDVIGEPLNLNWSYSRYAYGSQYSARPHVGLIPILNDLPAEGVESLPNRVLGYYDFNFPNYYPLPTFLRESKSITNNPETLDFARAEVIVETEKAISLGLQVKNSDDEWFDLVKSIGEIDTDGKTILEIKEFDLDNPVVLPKGENVLRSVLTVKGNLEITIDVLISP